MKKLILLLFPIIFCFSSFSQYNYAGKWPSKFRIGVEGGVSLISFFGNVTTEKTHIGTVGFNSGVFIQYSFNQLLHPDSTAKTTMHFGLKSGIYFDRKGAITTPASLEAAGLPPGLTLGQTELPSRQYHHTYKYGLFNFTHIGSVYNGKSRQSEIL